MMIEVDFFVLVIAFYNILSFWVCCSVDLIKFSASFIFGLRLYSLLLFFFCLLRSYCYC